MTVSQMLGIGFGKVGTCHLDERLKWKVRFKVSERANERVLYAFAVEDEIVYIGVCESDKTTLAARMNRYQGRIGRGTNKKVAEFLEKRLRKGLQVTILGWKPDADIRVGQFRVDLVKGLENPLIARASPELNFHGVSRGPSGS